MDDLKTCSGCKIAKPRSGFDRNRSAKDGLYSRCKSCKRASRVEYQRRNAEALQARRESMREQARARLREWYERHPGYAAAYYQANKEAHRERGRRWAQANTERRRVYSANRRARIAASGAVDVDLATEYIKLIFGDPCVYCGNPAEEIDHIHPLSRGGSSEWDNLAPTCRFCNRSKATKNVLQVLLERLRTEADEAA